MAAWKSLAAGLLVAVARVTQVLVAVLSLYTSFDGAPFTRPPKRMMSLLMLEMTAVCPAMVVTEGRGGRAVQVTVAPAIVPM